VSGTRLRVAILSDVHGNLSGLEAVATALRAEGDLDHVVVAGDHLQGGPRPVEVWERLRELGWTLLRGNEDEALATENPPYHGRGYRRAYLAQHAWYRALVPPGPLEALLALPEAWRIPTPAGDLLVLHASPQGTDDRRGGMHNTAQEVTEAYGGTGASAIAFGHYHQSFVRPMPFALLVNVASVGLPLDGLPLAAYTIMEATAGGWVVAQRRVPYDGALEARVARRRGLPPWEPD
jgi:predicted phosphodiesterase